MPLTATAFYFEDSNHVGAALVSVDLFAVPSVFHQEVARVFAARGPQSTLALERIVIAATHTHQGTSNFFSVAAHNRKASNVDGFDSRLRAFLIARLVAALDAAIADAARHPMFDLEIVTGLLPKTLLRNRSPKVFMENLNANDILDELGVTIPSGDDECGKERLRGEPRHDWKLSGCPRLRAVDRTVSLLRLRRDGRTAALAVFLAVHPTLLPSKTPLFSQDVFGVARDALEHSGDRIGYVTFFNGAEGDITLRRTTRDAADLIRLGQSLAAKLKAIHDTGTLRSIVADRIEGKLHFAKPGDAVGAPPVRLAAGALGGSEAIRGAEDDPGPLLGRVVAFVTRRTRRPRGEHGVKVPALLGVQKWTDSMFPPHEFPQRLPLSLVKIGDLELAAVPFEMNTSVGYAIRRGLGRGRGQLEIIGLANEYASYTASQDEYQKQDYMGAFTLWGPEQAPFIVKSLLTLQSAPPGLTGEPPTDAPGDARVALGPHMLDDDRGDIFHGLDNLLNGKHPPAFCWQEPTPPDLPAHSTRTVEVWRDGGGLADRHNIAVVMLGRPKAGQARWSAIWLAPSLPQPPSGRFRFKVTPDGHETITSTAFEADIQTTDCASIPLQQ